MIERARCLNCRYWHGIEMDYAEGDCRRYAPTELDRRGYGRAVWPRTRGEDSCGDHVRRPYAPIPNSISSEPNEG